MNTIILIYTPRGWLAQHSGPHAFEVVDLFGTDTIPTAFTAQAPSEVVAAEIRKLNPDCKVIA